MRKFEVTAISVGIVYTEHVRAESKTKALKAAKARIDQRAPERIFRTYIREL